MLEKYFFHSLYYILITALLLVSFPFLVCVAVIIVLTSGFPILFRQKRVGKDGVVFTIYKFRTMVLDAEIHKKQYLKLNESQGPAFKIHHDPRFTGVGKFLSHTGLDELPQLINVLCGEMSLIGPRPLPLLEAKKLRKWMRVREQVLPGIISPAILTGTYHKDFDAWMRRDVLYVKEKNPVGDVKLFILSFPFLVRLFVRSLLHK